MPAGVLRATACRKSLFFQKNACSKSLTPNPFPVAKGCVCLVGFASLQSPWAYTPGVRAGAILLGLPPLDPVGGYAPATPFLSTIGFIDSLMPAGVLRAGLIFVYCALFPSDDLSELVSSFLLSVLPVLSVPSGTSGFSTEAMSFI